MQNIVLIVHLLLALTLIGVVLLQRSEGGGLGIGGGTGPQSSRPPLTGLAKVTWALAIAFIATSLTLTIIAAQQSATGSVLDRLGVPTPPAPSAPSLPADGGDLLPPPADEPLAPPRAD